MFVALIMIYSFVEKIKNHRGDPCGSRTFLYIALLPFCRQIFFPARVKIKKCYLGAIFCILIPFNMSRQRMQLPQLKVGTR